MKLPRLLVVCFALALLAGCAASGPEPTPNSTGPSALTDPDQAAPVTGGGVFDVNQ